MIFSYLKSFRERARSVIQPPFEYLFAIDKSLQLCYVHCTKLHLSIFPERSFPAPRALWPAPFFMSSVKHTLRQHFIPHEGNNYHPHILHTKRAVFYSGLFIAMKVFLVAFAVALPTEAFLAPDVLAAQGAKMISLTNSLRKEQGLPLLDVNVVLERSASLKADDMSEKQYFSHVNPEGRGLSYFLGKAGYKYSTAGENLAMGFSDANEVVDAWMKSPKHYSNLVDTDFQQFGIGLVAGEFEGQPTVFVAQHFGTPKQEAKAPTPAPTQKPVVAAKVTAPVVPAVPTPSKPVAVAETEPVPVPVIQKPVEVAIVVPPKQEPALASATSATEVAIIEPSASSSLAMEVSTSSEQGGELLAVAEASTSSESVLGTNIPTRNQVDANESFVAWKDSGKNSTQISAQVFIEGPVAAATVSVAGYKIPLQKGEGNVYQGSLTAPISSKELFKVVISPEIQITWQDGTVMNDGLVWKNPKIISQTPWERYVQANSWLYGSIPVFPVVRGIYWFALIFFSIALALSIFVQIKKQHPHIIAQTIGLLGVISLMLWK